MRLWETKAASRLTYLVQVNMTFFQLDLKTNCGRLQASSTLNDRYCAPMWILQRVEAGRHGRIRLVRRRRSQDHPPVHQLFQGRGNFSCTMVHRLSRIFVVPGGLSNLQQNSTGQWLPYSESRALSIMSPLMVDGTIACSALGLNDERCLSRP